MSKGKNKSGKGQGGKKTGGARTQEQHEPEQESPQRNLQLVMFSFLPTLLIIVLTIVVCARFFNYVVLLAGIAMTIGTLCEAIWKLVVLKKGVNINLLRAVVYPSIILSIILIITAIAMVWNDIDINWLSSELASMPSLIFFMVGIFGLMLMGTNQHPLMEQSIKNEWRTEITNVIALAGIIAGILFMP